MNACFYQSLLALNDQVGKWMNIAARVQAFHKKGVKRTAGDVDDDAKCSDFLGICSAATKSDPTKISRTAR